MNSTEKHNEKIYRLTSNVTFYDTFLPSWVPKDPPKESLRCLRGNFWDCRSSSDHGNLWNLWVIPNQRGVISTFSPRLCECVCVTSLGATIEIFPHFVLPIGWRIKFQALQISSPRLLQHPDNTSNNPEMSQNHPKIHRDFISVRFPKWKSLSSENYLFQLPNRSMMLDSCW